MAARRPRPNYGGTSEQSIGKSPDADVAEPASTVGDTALPTLVSAPAPKSVFRRRLDSTWQLARKQCVSLSSSVLTRQGRLPRTWHRRLGRLPRPGELGDVSSARKVARAELAQRSRGRHRLSLCPFVRHPVRWPRGNRPASSKRQTRHRQRARFGRVLPTRSPQPSDEQVRP